MFDVETAFFPIPEPLKLSEIAEKTGAVIKADNVTDIIITDIAPLSEATESCLSFIDNPKYLDELAETSATACFCAKKYTSKIPDGVIALEVAEPYRAYAIVTALLYPKALKPAHGVKDGTISEQAYIAPSAKLEEGVTVEAFAYIDENAEIGANTYIAANARVGANVKIGRDCSITSSVIVQHALIGDRVILHPGVKIGQDGFGFAMSPQGHLKVPQIGRVIIQDDVEIGSNSTVDRGANRDTVIGEGTKIDNQVQIGHNVVVGRHCVLVSQVGISGSATLQDFVAIGGQSGVNGHVTIGMGAQIAAVSVVHDDVPPGARWGGVPARPAREWFKERLMLMKMVKENKKPTNKDS